VGLNTILKQPVWRAVKQVRPLKAVSLPESREDDPVFTWRDDMALALRTPLILGVLLMGLMILGSFMGQFVLPQWANSRQLSDAQNIQQERLANMRQKMAITETLLAEQPQANAPSVILSYSRRHPISMQFLELSRQLSQLALQHQVVPGQLTTKPKATVILVPEGLMAYLTHHPQAVSLVSLSLEQYPLDMTFSGSYSSLVGFLSAVVQQLPLAINTLEITPLPGSVDVNGLPMGNTMTLQCSVQFMAYVKPAKKSPEMQSLKNAPSASNHMQPVSRQSKVVSPW